jgi:hypothetical protein
MVSSETHGHGEISQELRLTVLMHRNFYLTSREIVQTLTDRSSIYGDEWFPPQYVARRWLQSLEVRTVEQESHDQFHLLME